MNLNGSKGISPCWKISSFFHVPLPSRRIWSTSLVQRLGMGLLHIKVLHRDDQFGVIVEVWVHVECERSNQCGYYIGGMCIVPLYLKHIQTFSLLKVCLFDMSVCWFTWVGCDKLHNFSTFLVSEWEQSSIYPPAERDCCCLGPYYSWWFKTTISFRWEDVDDGNVFEWLYKENLHHG